MTTPKPSLPWASVFHGATCVGHVVSRGTLGVEAFDVDDKSLGLFPTQEQAVNAVDAARGEFGVPSFP
jgi:hypothetical protein